MTDLDTAAYDLYRSLRTMPCNCMTEWQKNVKVVTAECRRCRAISQYETLCPDKVFVRVAKLETP